MQRLSNHILKMGSGFQRVEGYVGQGNGGGQRGLWCRVSTKVYSPYYTVSFLYCAVAVKANANEMYT